MAQEAPGGTSNSPSPCKLPVYLDLNWTDIPEPDAVPHTVDELQADLSSSTDLSLPVAHLLYVSPCLDRSRTIF